MSDNQEVVDSNDALPPPRQPVDRDWLLLEFIRLAELGIEQGITVICGGCLVTGTVISASSYFSLMANEVVRAKESAIGDTAIYDTLKGNYDTFRELMAEMREEDKYQPPIRDYIHLREARIVLGSAHVPSKRGVLWRGRVSSVDAFFSGSVTAG